MKIISHLILLIVAFSMSAGAQAKEGSCGNCTHTKGKNGQQCATNIECIISDTPIYREICSIVKPGVIKKFKSLVEKVYRTQTQASYSPLFSYSKKIASKLKNGRIVVCQQDAGIVIIDTAQPDDPDNLLPQGNSLEHWLSNTVNPSNHNTRLAIFSAQLYPCGIGAETALSASVGQLQAGVAFRLNTSVKDYTQSSGTVRLSQVPFIQK